MADVRPFRGLRYNLPIAGDISQTICPPFDTISADLQKSLHQRSPYNIVRLELGETRPSDTPKDNRYTRAAATFKDWMNKQVLAREAESAFYLVRHTFSFRGSHRERLELMACVRLEEYSRRVVLPHEYTRDEDKNDRLSLIQACHANFSPIMCLYRDEQKRLSQIFQRTMAEPPMMDLSDMGEQGYLLWKIGGTEQTNEIKESMASRPLYIADGHHRYETALNYRNISTSGRQGAWTTDEEFNFVMMGLIEFDDPGLQVLPYHRVARGLSEATLRQVHDGLARFFHQLPFPNATLAGYERLLEEIEVRGRDQVVMGLLDPSGGVPQLLTLKEGVVPEAWGPIGGSEAWILEEQVLKPVLGDSLGRCLDYIHDGDEVVEKVRTGQYQLGFLLRPFPIGLFETIMNTGQRLPPKSTFFYPKLPAGLVINLLEGDI